MKKLLLSAIITIISAGGLTAQNDPTIQPGQIPVPAQTTNPEFVQFKELSYDFGNIRQSTPASHTFTFKNIGTRDITLVNVNASCGCTTPNWKGGAYKPQETGEITATFNANAEGFFSKTVTVTTSEGVVMLTISGTVLTAAAYDEWKAKTDAEAAAKAPTKKTAAKKAKSPAKTKPKASATKPKTATQGS